MKYITYLYRFLFIKKAIIINKGVHSINILNYLTKYFKKFEITALDMDYLK